MENKPWELEMFANNGVWDIFVATLQKTPQKRDVGHLEMVAVVTTVVKRIGILHFCLFYLGY